MTALSPTAGLDSIQTNSRWDKKQELDVVMSAVIKDYNKQMGGVDILDSVLAKYRSRIKIKTVVCLFVLAQAVDWSCNYMANEQKRSQASETAQKRVVATT